MESQDWKMNKKPSTKHMVRSNVVTFAMFVANIIMGAVYLDDCPRQPYIPIYLIVLGTMGMVPIFYSCFWLPRIPRSTSSLNMACIIGNGLVSVFLLCWFICGNVWIYSIYQPNYNQSESNYCNRTLYLFAFWSHTLTNLIVLGLCVVLCFCCCFCRGALGTYFGRFKAESVPKQD